MAGKVIKRDGSIVDFDEEKIKCAILGAMRDVGEVTQRERDIAAMIAHTVRGTFRNREKIGIEEIQDLVETNLMKHELFDVAKAYIRYRYDREKARSTKENFQKRFNEFQSLIRGTNEEVNHENSNKDTRVASVMRDYIAGFSCKEMARAMIPSDIMEAHDKGILKIHDLDYSPAMPIHNCELINLEDMLQNGTVMNEVQIDKPKSFKTACTITSQISAQVCSVTYGGQTINLSHLAPFVNISRQKHRKEIKKEFEVQGVKCDDTVINNLAEARLKKEISDGIQTLQYQWVTLNGTNGQAAFVTLFMYINDVPEGQLRDDLVLLIEEVLHQRIKGVKNKKGAYITIAFPKLIYVLDENNIYEDSEYWWLTKLAAECSSKRLVPDYVSAKRMKQMKEGQVVAPMGCVDGREVISYVYNGEIYEECFSRAWDQLNQYFEAKKQPNGQDEYMDLEGVEIYDTKKGFVPCYRMIRNTQDKWIRVGLSSGYSIDVTEDHPFETENRGLVLAKNLTLTDKILCDYGAPAGRNHMVKKQKSIEAEICKVTSLQKKPLVKKHSYDVTTASEHFTVSGIYSHNCRSLLSPWKDEFGKYKLWGRFNQGVVTLNLPHIALSSDGDINKFWTLFDERLDLCFRALMIRHNALKGVKSDIAPILWQHGALARLQPGETIDKLLYGSYSTISLGYAGLHETVFALTGKSLTSPEGHDLGLQIMKKLESTVNKWKKETNIGFALYGTPLETTTDTFARCLKDQFGIIKGITDKGYVTNSYHVTPSEHIDAFSKLSFESEFQDLSLGGAISYVETPNMQNNIPALLEVMKHIYKTNLYAEINTTTSYCHICGCRDLKMGDDLKYHCPQCGNDDWHKMNIAVRVCGYISTNPYAEGRAKDIHDRVYHLGD